MKEELIDVYDAKGNSLNIAKTKSEIHKVGYWHRSFHCWVIYRSNEGVNYIVLQKRSSNKKSWPNKLDITAAGHLISGEGLEGGLRELKEEIGIDTSISKLIFVGRRICIEEFDSNSINHEFQDVFFLVDKRPLDKYKMQQDELSGLVAVKIDLALELFSTEINQFNALGISFEGDQIKENKFTITREDFIPTLDDYNYKIMILANRILNGEKHLRI